MGLCGCAPRIAIVEEGLHAERLGQRLVQKGRYAWAAEAFGEAIRKRPGDAALWYNRGNAFLKNGEEKEALKNYDRATDIDGDFVDAWYNKGLAFLALGQQRDAAASFREVLTLAPDQAADLPSEIRRDAALLDRIPPGSAGPRKVMPRPMIRLFRVELEDAEAKRALRALGKAVDYDVVFRGGLRGQVTYSARNARWEAVLGSLLALYGWEGEIDKEKQRIFIGPKD